MSAVPAFQPPPALQSLQTSFALRPIDAPEIDAVRRQAFEQFLAQGFPAARDEDWKYTSLRRLEMRQFAPSQLAEAPIEPAHVFDAYRMVFVDGHYQAGQSTLPAEAKVRVLPLSALFISDPQQAAAVLDAEINQVSRFVALNAAFARDGVLIELANGAQLGKPLHVSFIWRGAQQDSMAHPRVVVRAGAYSKVVLLEEYSGAGETPHLTNAVTLLLLGEGAQVEHHRVQNESAATSHIGMLHAELAAHATLLSHHFNLGGALGRLDLNVYLNGAEAGVDLNGLQFAAGNQHHDTHTWVHHRVPNTRSNEDYRGIADQRGRVVFNGKVIVHKKAIRTDARQSSRNLLLARSAEIDTKPELEIYADDVKCAHGATVGQLDANALFYLRSRGIDEAQARALLTYAFADSVISRASIAALREQLAQAVHARFEGGAS